MTKTKIQGTIAQIIRTIGALPWGEFCDRTANGLRACWVAAELLLAFGAIAWQVAYEHRQQIRSALVHLIAALVVASVVTYRAGRRARRWWGALLEFSEQMGHWYASLLVRPAAAEPAVVEPAPAVHLEPEVADLTRLSCRELREMLGIHKHLPKRRLLELAGAA